MSEGNSSGDLSESIHNNTSVTSQTEHSRRDYKIRHHNLAMIIASQNVNFEAIADVWVNVFETKAEEASQILLELLYDSAGYKLITETALSADKELPLLIACDEYQKNLSVFFEHLMTPQVIGATSLMKRLSSWLISMSTCKWDSFRLTAVIVAGQLITSFLEAEKLVIPINLDESGSDSENEVDSSVVNKDKDYIHCYLNNLFKEIIHPRSRDVENDIRMKVISLLLDWILHSPNKMAEDSYLKYITFFFCDETAAIRLYAVKATMKIVKKINDFGKLMFFLINVVRKLLTRINDVDDIVGAAAIKALDLIDSYFEDKFPYVDNDIYMEMYSTDENKRLAAGNFLLRKIGEHDNEKSYITDLVRFQLESPVKECGEFLISSIFKKIPCLTNWDSWINCLNDESNMKIKIIICQLMLHTVRIAATGQKLPWYKMKLIFFPVDENINQQILLESEVEVNNQESITKYFCKTLINLLKKYEDEPKCLLYFLAIPQFFHYSTDSLVMMPIIDEMERIALTSEDKAVINNAIYHLKVIDDKMPNSLKKLSLQKLENFKIKIINEYFIPSANRLISNKEMIDEYINLEKAEALAKYCNLSNTPVWELALKGLINSIEKCNNLAIDKFANICFFNVQWKLKGIIDSLKIQHHPSEIEIMQLKSHNHELLYCAIKILSSNSSKIIKSTAFVISCDLLTIFSSRNKIMKNVLPAAIHPTRLQLEWLANFITSSVNAAAADSLDKELLLAYCMLLENSLIPPSNVPNILPFFQTEAYNKMLIRPLHALLRNKITMKATVTSLVYGLEVLLRHCQNKEEISNQVLENILNGICESIDSKHSGLEEAILHIHIIGFECILLGKNTPFFNILEFFVPHLRKLENVVKLQDLIKIDFPYLISTPFGESYMNSLNKVKEVLGQTSLNTTSDSNTSDEEQLPSDINMELDMPNTSINRLQ